ncbi:hypothetical protein D9M71_779040 [compost metagenome]
MDVLRPGRQRGDAEAAGEAHTERLDVAGGAVVELVDEYVLLDHGGLATGNDHGELADIADVLQPLFAGVGHVPDIVAPSLLG